LVLMPEIFHKTKLELLILIIESLKSKKFTPL
jgi:hypothetical protein